MGVIQKRHTRGGGGGGCMRFSLGFRGSGFRERGTLGGGGL